MIKNKKMTNEDKEIDYVYGTCDNCGANLKANKYDDSFKCNYCGTEYYKDYFGNVIGQIVELKIFGKLKKFYISQVECNPIYMDYGRDLLGERYSTMIDEKFKVELVEI